MNANELRIGNFVSYEEKVWQVNSILPITKTYLDYEPIPLSEEWLVKLGFQCMGVVEATDEYINGTTEYRIGDDGQEVYDKDGKFLYQIDLYDDEYGWNHITKLVEFVHQLQNLHFALTGEELTVK